MTLLPRHTAAGIVRVEVSGWDKHQAFFVEKSELRCSAPSVLHIALATAVPDGAVIFVKPLPGLRAGGRASLALQTEFVGTTPEGRCYFRLHTLRSWTHRHAAVRRDISIH